MSNPPCTRRTDVLLLRMFAHLNTVGVAGRTAEAHLILQSGDQLTVRAGGPGIHASAFEAPFTTYEVLSSSDTEPPYWRRYGNGRAGVVYAQVPPLLIAHYVHRSGGVIDSVFEDHVRVITETMDLRLAITPAARRRVLDMLAMIGGVEVLKTSVQV